MKKIDSDWKISWHGRLRALQLLFIIALIVYVGLFSFSTTVTDTQVMIVAVVTFLVLVVTGWIRWRLINSIARDKIMQWLSEFRGMADGEVKVFEDPSQVVVNAFHRELHNSGIPHVHDLRGGTTVKVTRAMDTDGIAS